jgi:hypothetical protein
VARRFEDAGVEEVYVQRPNEMRKRGVESGPERTVAKRLRRGLSRSTSREPCKKRRARRAQAVAASRAVRAEACVVCLRKRRAPAVLRERREGRLVAALQRAC